MNWIAIVVDLLIILFLVIWARTGWKRGFITELATLIGLIIGLFVAFRFSPGLAVKFGWTHQAAVDAAIWFAISFIAIYLVAQLIGQGISERFHVLGMGLLNRIAGLALSVIEGLAFIAATGYALSLYAQGQALLQSTYLLKAITAAVMPIFAPLIP